jgi:hypothetical protein
LQCGTITAHAGFTPGAIESFKLLFVGIATLANSNCGSGNHQQ